MRPASAARQVTHIVKTNASHPIYLLERIEPDAQVEYLAQRGRIISTQEVPVDSIGSPVHWIGFVSFVLLMLALDLGVFHRHAHAVKVKEALTWSLVWVALAAAFGGLVYFLFGQELALEFAAGYVIEKALSVDNLFVFVVLFGAFQIPPRSQ